MPAVSHKRPTLLFGYAIFGIAIPILLACMHLSSYTVSHTVSNITKKSLSISVPPRIKINDTGIPIRLRIPILNIDSAIESVGLTPDGAMDIKSNQDNTAWYKFGPRPGNQGSAVIAGHYGWDHQKASVFTRLSKLQKGDEIYVDSDTRVSTAFVVREMRKYTPDANAATIFNSNDGGAHLNLITCGGSWSEAKETYSDRLVVFTDKI